MIRRLLFFLAALLMSPLFALAAEQPQLNAGRIETDPQTGDLVLTGNARLDYDGAVLLAEQIRYNAASQVAVARGKVTLTRGERRLVADEITYRVADRTYDVTGMRLGEAPFYVSGNRVSGTRDTVVVHDAIATYQEPGLFVPTLTADRLELTPDRTVRANDAYLGIGPVKMIPLRKFEQSMSDPLISYMSAHVGYRGPLGPFAELGLHVPVYPGVKAGGDVAYYMKRGVLFGPSGTYHSSVVGQEIVGSFSSGYIDDHGDKKTDVLNRPIDEDRGFVDWTHNQRVNENITLLGQLQYWSDSGVLRDFRPDRFMATQQPDTFGEAIHAQENLITSLFVRPNLHSYYHVQQRLPELRVDLLPKHVGDGFLVRFNASAAALREHAFSMETGDYVEGPTIESNRLDAFYSLSRPIAPREWLAVTPIVGARVTHYGDATGGRHSYTRALGEIGADASLRASGVYAYKNERWDIDGIRHLVTPKLSYRYIPKADKGRAYIPAIDRRVFDTSLPPLELGDQRNVDDLRATNTLRIGLENTFQTRDATYGSRDLLIVNLAEDIRFRNEPGERDFSEIHTGVSLMPVRWMRFDLYNSFAPQNFTMREFNTRFSIFDGDVWAASISNHYLQHQIEEYIGEASYRFNEVYQGVLRLHFDSRRSRFNERSVALRQNLEDVWDIEYRISYYEGRKREGGFGMSVEVRLVGL